MVHYNLLFIKKIKIFSLFLKKHLTSDVINVILVTSVNNVALFMLVQGSYNA